MRSTYYPALLVAGLVSAAFIQTPAPTFDLPAPTGKSPIGTTRWNVTDSSRDETFAPGKKREVACRTRTPASKYYQVDVKDTLHLNFTDMNYWGGPLRQRGAYRKIDPARAAEITRTVVREFFGQEILEQPSALLSGKQLLKDVTVVEVNK